MVMVHRALMRRLLERRDGSNSVDGGEGLFSMRQQRYMMYPSFYYIIIIIRVRLHPRHIALGN